MSTASNSLSVYNSENMTRFYECLIARSLIASNWPANTELHNFGLEYGEGAGFRKVFFHIASENLETFVQLADRFKVGHYVLDAFTTDSVAADRFPSRKQYGNVLGWHLRQNGAGHFPTQVTLRQFMLARRYQVFVARRPSDTFAQLLDNLGILIPREVAEPELARVNSNRKLETQPFILEENSSQSVGRGYGIIPLNEAGQQCKEALSESKKRRLFSTRVMHRFGWAHGGIYVPASPERVMAMLSVVETMAAADEDLSWMLHPDCLTGENVTPLTFLETAVTDRAQSQRFPCQDVFCLKWRMSANKLTQSEQKSLVSLGQWLHSHGYLKDDWQCSSDGSLQSMRA